MDLREYLRVFRAHWLGMVLITFLGVAVAFGWALLQPKAYTADASAIVQAASTSTDSSSDLSSAMLGNTLTAGRVKTYVTLGQSRAVAQGVIDDLHLSASPEQLVTKVAVANAVDTVNLEVTVTATTPEMARSIAEAWVKSMASEVNRLETGDPDTKGAVFLSPIDSARLPDAPSSPNTRLALAVGGVGGFGGRGGVWLVAVHVGSSDSFGGAGGAGDREACGGHDPGGEVVHGG